MSKQCLRILRRLNPTRLYRIVTNTSTRCIVTHRGRCIAATLDTRGVFAGTPRALRPIREPVKKHTVSRIAHTYTITKITKITKNNQK